MEATEFEYRHPTLVHQAIVGVAFLTYLIDRQDFVWRLVKDSGMAHTLERGAFVIATLLIAAGAVLCTSGRAYSKSNSGARTVWYRVLENPRYLGELCYAIGLGSLAPFAGFLILVGGEFLRVLRLAGRIDGDAEDVAGWKKAFRQEATKWGILLTMITFVITLNDRHAEVLAVASLFVGLKK
jgi:hypothetical protein